MDDNEVKISISPTMQELGEPELEEKFETCNSIAPNQICEVCDQQAHGIHFGVIACRACAAFFRRNITVKTALLEALNSQSYSPANSSARTVVMNKEYSCRRAGNNCEITKDVRYLCRYCRFEKCLRVGMTTDNVQWNRDRLSSSKKVLEKKNLKKQTEQMTYNPYAESEPTISSPASVIQFGGAHDIKEVVQPKTKEHSVVDLSNIVLAIEHELKNFTPDFPPGLHLTALQRMTVAMQRLRSKVSPTPTVASCIEISSYKNMWTKSSTEIAQCIMHCEEFAMLPIAEKIKIFKVSWCTFHRFEKLAASLALFGEEVFTQHKVLISDDVAVDESTHYDVSAISNYPPDEVTSFFKPSVLRSCHDVGRPMYELQLSPYEQAFIMCLLLWNLEGLTVEQSTMNVADAFRERIAGELHDYYVHTLRLHNYADRLIQVMSLVQATAKIQYDKAQLMEVARIFDVFNVSFDNETKKFFEHKR